jgi:hypothetical protein
VGRGSGGTRPSDIRSTQRTRKLLYSYCRGWASLASIPNAVLTQFVCTLVRRLVSLCAGEGTVLDQLPANWLTALPRGATLVTLDDWQRALKGMVLDHGPLDAGRVLHTLLSLLAIGPNSAGEAAAALLRGISANIWEAANQSTR